MDNMLQADFFIQNRKRVAEALDGNILVLSAYDKMQQTNDAAAPFKQESNFWWLTGIALPGWKLGIETDGSEYLVRPNLSTAERVFESWLSDESATKTSGVTKIISDEEFSEKIQSYSAKGATVRALRPLVYDDIYSHPNPAIADIWQRLARADISPVDTQLLLAKLRAIKTDQEIAMIERAIAVTNSAFELVESRLASYTNEREVAADFTYEFMRQGVEHAYEPIVAFGANACTLHYVENNSAINDGLLLLDIGACVDGYSADITRTYAVGGVTAREKAVHAAVVEVQQAIIALLAPGLKTRDYIANVDTIMKQQLIKLGLIADESDEKYRTYFPHAISHGLGVDVHDSLGQAEVLQPGMVLTVEPGIYIPEEGIGVRIEDDILITSSGHRNLSKSLSTQL